MSWFRAAGKVRLPPCGTFAKASSPARALIPSALSPLLRGALLILSNCRPLLRGSGFALAPQDEDGRCRRAGAPQNDAAVLRLGLILRCERSEPRRIEAKSELISQRSPCMGGRELK